MKFLAGFFILFFLSSIGLSATDYTLLTDLTYSSKYMIDGFHVGNSPVMQLTLKAPIKKTGLYLMYWNSIQTERNQKNFDEHDLFAMYSKDFFENSNKQINFHGYYDYWNFPNWEPPRDNFGDTIGSKLRHGNKFQLGISMPQLIRLGDYHLVPTYNIYYLYFYAQDREDLFEGGIEHELSLEYSIPLKVVLPKTTHQYLTTNAGVFYNQGTFGVNPGFSNAVLAMTTGAYALSSIFELSLRHQWTFESSVNQNNEYWSTFSFIKKY
jgi:hypothetical protein